MAEHHELLKASRAAEKQEISLQAGLLGFGLTLGGVEIWLSVVPFKMLLYATIAILIRDFNHVFDGLIFGLAG